jgi:hypothetical protein
MWIITKDIIDGGNCERTCSRDYDGSELSFPFRMFDDDDNLYYEGLSDDNDSEEAFAPLDDFGMGNAGCTSIQYKNLKSGLWETL